MKEKVKVMSFCSEYDMNINDSINEFIRKHVKKLISIQIAVSDRLKEKTIGNTYTNFYESCKTVLIVYEEKEYEEK